MDKLSHSCHESLNILTFVLTYLDIQHLKCHLSRKVSISYVNVIKHELVLG